jgi:hypothetical protein
MSAPPMLVIELPLEGHALAMLDYCYSEADERRILFDLARRDLLGETIDAVHRLLTVLDDEGAT